MKNIVNVSWNEKMQFVSTLNGHQIVMDTDTDNGGDDGGPRPKALLMVALGGCTGMDVISILRKMKEDVHSFTVRIEGVSRDEHPMRYERMHVIYAFKGNQLDPEKVKKAVDLSVTKYCGVIATLKDSVELSFDIDIQEG